jgi:diguanylate cyclase (GGDEF)-like protein
MYDLDHFKLVNDTYGHQAGDMVLRETAALVRGFVRKEECFARYGGEEFCLAQPEVTLANAAAVADKARRAIEAAQLVWNGVRIPVTISAGVAELPAGSSSVDEFIRLADERLYKAKHGGRNRVVAD